MREFQGEEEEEDPQEQTGSLANKSEPEHEEAVEDEINKVLNADSFKKKSTSVESNLSLSETYPKEQEFVVPQET